ncbi:carboxymuconolactone decarboxylase family protein [Streptomyces sp. ISL-10]|uniref:carboxymuconolactone decarboxylase family protein n=1 Tax=Streptomyces sp. ISL-10 TaxID=2819172 RepID=UPI001BEB825E|nr:carboxymuconolactone decarboxylase family protein [Streptomyces sp. ISL-10]MBT2368898.1 carboxymuconolactone decarboxylase family protein [Streptomyces sp. ISL-10]
MNARIELDTLAKDAYRGIGALDRHVAQSTLPPALVELVRLRASQINGCVYCVDMHSADATKAGETTTRLHAVAVWQEAPLFTEQERAALALTEAGTRLSEGGDRVPEEVWGQAAQHFTQEELAALVVAITAVNAWNRIGVITRMVPASYENV